jgi:hypothetical protein
VARHIFQACPVWIYTQSNITNIIFTWVHNTTTENIIHNLSTVLVHIHKEDDNRTRNRSKNCKYNWTGVCVLRRTINGKNFHVKKFKTERLQVQRQILNGIYSISDEGLSGWVYPNTPSIITSQLRCFQLRTTLNGKDFKFFSHGLCTEKQNILLEHMHEKNSLFWPINVEIGFNTKTRLIYWSKWKIFSCMCWRRMFCFSVHSPWETNLKSFPFKVVLSWKQCSCDVIIERVY